MQSADSPVLKRTLKPSWVFAFAVGSEIGWGAFILPYDWLATAGMGGITIGFLIATALILIIGINYGVAIRALPRTGGGIFFALAGGNRIFAYAVGWALTLGYAGIVALNASAVTLLFRVTVPNLVMHGKLYTVAGWDVYLPEVIIASLFLLAFAWLNIRGFEFSGRFQYVSVIVLLAGVAFILVAVIVKAATGEIHMAPAFPEGTSKWAATFAIVAIAPWAYVGFDSIPQLAGEFKFSAAKALKLLVLGILSATFVYLAMSLSTAISVGSRFELYSADPWPTGTAISDLVGTIGLVAMVLAVSAGVLTGLNGFTASASRVLFTMGKVGMLPQRFALLSKKFGTPAFATIFVTVTCLVTPWFGRAALTWIVDMTSVGIALAYFSTSLFGFRLARGDKMIGVDRQENSFFGQFLGILGCAIALFFIVLLLGPGMPGQLSKESLIALAIWVLLGLLLFWGNWKTIRETSEEEMIRVPGI